MKNNSPFGGTLNRLRTSIRDADYVFNRDTYLLTKDFFTMCHSSESSLKALESATPEYHKDEFLRCVDKNGITVVQAQEVINDFRQTIKSQPAFKRWFQEVDLQKKDSKKPILLIARWLSHLAGFRHVSVHLFIDHPVLTNYTLAQVRSINKAESPAQFDLPAAGHVNGIDSIENTLENELKEELNLEANDIHNLEKIACYEYIEPHQNSDIRNIEHRVVFTCRLRQESLLKIRFMDKEVAAISMFSISELESLLKVFSNKAASGLRESFPFFLKTKGSAKATTA